MQRISYDLVQGQVGRDRESLVVLQECQGWCCCSCSDLMSFMESHPISLFILRAVRAMTRGCCARGSAKFWQHFVWGYLL